MYLQFPKSVAAQNESVPALLDESGASHLTLFSS